MLHAASDFPSGLIVPIATPITAEETVSEADLRKLVRHLLDGGVDGLFVLGTTGEVGALTDRERERAVEIVIAETDGRVPVSVGVSAEGTKRVCANIQRLSTYGPDAFAATPPYYFPAALQDELLAFYRSVMAATDRPFIIYNHPTISGAWVAAETVARLAEIENCVGLKDGSGDFRYFQGLLREPRITENIHLLQGNEPLLLPSLLTGAHGGLNGIANIAPRLFKSLITAFADGDLDRARQLHANVVALARVVYESGENPLTAIKAGLEILGLGDGRPCAPFKAPAAETCERLRATLCDIGECVSSPGHASGAVSRSAARTLD